MVKDTSVVFDDTSVVVEVSLRPTMAVVGEYELHGPDTLPLGRNPSTHRIVG
jgi:hypothetical protein